MQVCQVSGCRKLVRNILLDLVSVDLVAGLGVPAAVPFCLQVLDRVLRE